MGKSLNIRGDHGDETRTYASKAWQLGTRMHLSDGRIYRLARAGAALTRARVAQVARQDMALVDRALVFPRTGPRAVVVTPNFATSIPADTYEDGLLYVNDGTGEGFVYHLAGNPERGNSSLTLSTHLDSDWVVLPDSSTRVTLVRNRYHGLTTAAAPPQTAVAGVSPVAVSVNHYFWLQTSGPCVVLQQDDLEAYIPVAASRLTGGAVAAATIVVPRSAEFERQGAEGLMVEQVLSDDAGPVKGRLAPTTGAAVVPAVPIGYALNPREHGQHCLVQLTLE